VNGICAHNCGEVGQTPGRGDKRGTALARPGQARRGPRVLAPVYYGWFTEGFDTRDLKEAKALLDELTA
jgi:hypothetical protein